MKVALVFPDSEAFSKDVLDSMMWINHGLALLSAAVKRKGHDVHLIDLRICADWEEYEQKLSDISPDVVGITGMTIDFPNIKMAAELSKKRDFRVPVVVGGIHASLVTEDIANLSGVDHIVLGEGEISFPKLLDEIESGKANDRIIQGERTDDLDTLPFPDRDLFSHCREAPHFQNLEKPFVTILSSRGCMYRCTFCQPAERILFGNKVRRRSVDNVIEELQFINDTKSFNSMMIHDDCLTEARKWVYEFCDKYIKAGFKQPWVCQVRADHVCKYPEMIERMKQSGLSAVHVGFESGSQRILDLIKKGVTVEQNYEACKILKTNDIEVQGMFMVGFPFETKADVRATIKMMKEMGLERPSLAFFTPYPGSELYDYCKEKNLLSIKDYSHYDRAKKTQKIKGIDYDYLVRQFHTTWPLKQRIKHTIKQTMQTIMGEKTSKKILNVVKKPLPSL